MKTREEYLETIHKLGRTTNAIALLLMISVPLIAIAITGAIPEIGRVLSTLIPIALVWIVMAAAEFMAYVPILGPSGAYLSFVTGNIANMKLPASIAAQKSLGAKKGSEEAEVASTIAISTTSIVTVFILIMGLLMLPILTPILSNEVLKPGFNNIMPALLGALAAPYLLASPKKAIVPSIVMLIIYYVIFPLVSETVVLYMGGFLMVIVISISVLTSYIIWKIQSKKQ